jgi:uncharacterized protein YjbI with pentapeptide repeats
MRCTFTFDPAGNPNRECAGPVPVRIPPHLDRDNRLDVRSDPTDVWTCPHDARDGDDYCLFHASPSTYEGDAAFEAFLDVVNAPPDGRRGDASRSREFVGASFRRFDLAGRVLSGPDMATIDLRHATFGTGEETASTPVLSLRDAVVDHPIDLSGAIVGGAVDCDRARFRSTVACRDALFGGRFFARQTVFDGEAAFEASYFGDTADVQESEFSIGPSFRRCAFDDAFNCADARFGRRNTANFFGASFGEATFRSVVSESDVNLKETTADTLDLSRLSCDGDLLLERISGRTLVATNASITGDLRVRRTADDLLAVDCSETTVGETATFSRLGVLGELDLSGLQAPRLDVEHGELYGGVDLSEAAVDRLRLAPDAPSESTALFVDCRRATLRGGRIDLPAVDHRLVDLRRATVGPVEFSADGGDLLGSVLFYETAFDGYDFAKSALELAAHDHRLHTLTDRNHYAPAISDRYPDAAHDGDDDPAATDYPEPAPGEVDDLYRTAAADDYGRERPYVDDVTLTGLIVTYLKAKTGASDVGASEAAGAFFIHEMSYRGQRHFETARTHLTDARTALDDRASSGRSAAIRAALGSLNAAGRAATFRWLPNELMGVSAAYGERPRRVLLSVAVVIVAFAAAYWGIGVDVGLSSGPLLAYLVFSVQVFVTLFYGTASDSADASVLEAGLVASEALLGAVLIALFIFTLGRQVYR